MSKEIIDILSPALGDDLAKDIIAHRRGKKCPLTARGAKALLREYEATGNAVAAAEEHLNRGWQGFKAEWVKKGSGFHDPHNPMPKVETREEYLARAIARNNEDWESNDRAKQARNVISLATRQ